MANTVLRYVLAIGMLLCGTEVFAEEIPLFYKGIRPLGMGGAFTAVADDENAMFYNPAGMNNIEGFGGLELLNPMVEVGNNTVDFYRDLKEVLDADTSNEQTRRSTDLLNKWLGKQFHLRTGLFPNLTLHNFGIGLLAQGTFDGEVHNLFGPNALELRGVYDGALLLSFGYGFKIVNDNALQIGVTGKYVYRGILDELYAANDLVNIDSIDFDRDLKKGSGYGFDLGVIYSLPVFLSPSIGFNLQNVTEVNLGDAGTLPQQLNVGVALKPNVGFGKLVLALDVVDISRQIGTDDDLYKRVLAGAEYSFPMLLALRAGFHQGYVSGGFTVDLWFLKLVYAYYIEEVGAYAGQIPDRRHAAQASLGF